MKTPDSHLAFAWILLASEIVRLESKAVFGYAFTPAASGLWRSGLAPGRELGFFVVLVFAAGGRFNHPRGAA
jgi:hypothetical protein